MAMYSSIVIGMGEVGQPLYEIIKEVHPVAWADVDTLPEGKYQIMNVCFPYSEGFVEEVKKYQEMYEPELTIIHSTVPIGTTSQIPDAVHSPVLGDHKNMKKSMLTFVKWIGGEFNYLARDYFRSLNIETHCVEKPEETEMLKLMCLAKYGMSIAFAQYQKNLFDKYKFNYQDVVFWDMHYNDGLKKLGRNALLRPIIIPYSNTIGGHCVIQNTKILNEQYPNPILEEILKYDPNMATV
jgi:UDP-glucose 6-dehydrogenase